MLNEDRALVKRILFGGPGDYEQKVIEKEAGSRLTTSPNKAESKATYP